MEEPSINYDLTFRSFSQKIKSMRVGSIKRCWHKEDSEAGIAVGLNQGNRGWSFQAEPL